MKIEKKTYKRFNAFFTDTLPTGALGKNLYNFIYRGESTNKYTLLPSALRLENKNKLFRNNQPIDEQSDWEYFYIQAEYSLLKEFYKISNRSGLKIPYVKSIRDNYVDIFTSEITSNMQRYK